MQHPVAIASCTVSWTCTSWQIAVQALMLQMFEGLCPSPQGMQLMHCCGFDRIADPEASKPDDWDEDAPKEILDEEAEKPEGWLDDEPEEIDDPGNGDASQCCSGNCLRVRTDCCCSVVTAVLCVCAPISSMVLSFY